MISIFPRKLIRTAVFVCVCVCLAACGGREARIAKHMERANAFLAQAQYAKARLEVKNALQIDPKSAAAYLLAGRIAEREGDWNVAYVYYEKAVETDPASAAARTRLGRAYLTFGEIAKARHTIAPALESSARDPDLRTLHAAIEAAAGNLDLAAGEGEAVLEADPKREDAVSLLAGIYKKRGDNARAEEALRRGAAANPTSIALRLDLASLYLQTGKTEQAEAPLREVARLAPASFEHQVRLAAYYSNASNLDAAEKVLRAATAADPLDEMRSLALADFLARKRTLAAADKELMRHLSEHPKATGVRLALARLLAQQSRHDAAQVQYQHAIEQAGTAPALARASNEYALFLVSRGKHSEAEKIISAMLKDNPRDEAALLTRGKLALVRRDALGAVGDFRTLAKSDPASPEYLGLLARAHLINREPELARESLAQAAERNPDNVQAATMWIDYLAMSGDYANALAEADKAIKAMPFDSSLLELKAAIETVAKKPRQAEQTMLQLKQVAGGSFYLANRRYDAALTEFEQALGKTPRDFDSLAGLVQAYLGLGRADNALARVQTQLKTDPDNPKLTYLTGEIFAAQGKRPEAEAALHKAIAAQPKWTAPRLRLANLLSAAKDFKAARTALDEGLKALPGDPTLTFSLARTLEAEGEFDRAASTYEALLEANPAMDIAANNLASLLTDRRADKASLERALQLAARFELSTNPTFLDTLGWAYVKSGQTARAVALLQRAVESTPEVAVFNYHLGVAKHQAGDKAAAKRYLARAIGGNGEYPGAAQARSLYESL
jgi:Tfp pilus assembly protein PilF